MQEDYFEDVLHQETKRIKKWNKKQRTPKPKRTQEGQSYEDQLKTNKWTIPELQKQKKFVKSTQKMVE